MHRSQAPGWLLTLVLADISLSNDIFLEQVPKSIAHLLPHSDRFQHQMPRNLMQAHRPVELILRKRVLESTTSQQEN